MRPAAALFPAGLGLTPEDRKTTGLILKHSIESNLCYAGMKKTTINGWVESRKKRKEMSERQVKALQIKLSSISAKASSMSGRNQDGRKWNIPSENIIVRGCFIGKNSFGGGD